MERSLLAIPKAVVSLCWLAAAGLSASACGDDGGGSGPRDAGAEIDDGGAADARPAKDAEVGRDADAPEELEDGSAGPDTELDATMEDGGLAEETHDGEVPEAGCEADGATCPAGDPLAPFSLDCAHLPSGGACQGGPREVLLVTAYSGHILMFDPADGHFLGYFKREPAEHNNGFLFATQGPDQCVWSVNEFDTAVQRWNTDGTFKDAPLEETFVPVHGQPEELVIQNPHAIAFSHDRLFVASWKGTPNPRVTRWQLDGKYDGVVLEDELEISSLLAMGDGSLLVADDRQQRVVRIPAGGGLAEPILGGLERPSQLSYAAAGKALVADDDYGEPIYELEIESGKATTIFPEDTSDGVKGVALLRNGKWLITGGEYEVSVLDPASSNPSGQYQVVWTDNAVAPGDFFHVGRACLSEAFLASRASKPANDVCINPPAGGVIFEEHFETGAFTGSGTSRHFNAFYDLGVAEVTTSIDATAGVGGSRALKITGTGQIDTGDPYFPQRHKTGMVANFAGGQPTYVSYRVKVASADQVLGYLLLENAAAATDESDWLAGTRFSFGILGDLNSNAETENELVDEWVQVELRNIDWNTRTYDLYINCERLAEAIGLPAGLGDTIDRIDVYNLPVVDPDANTVAWYDDIVVIK